jgi:glycosyltransferase involved in cell wall biosynthesis
MQKHTKKKVLIITKRLDGGTGTFALNLIKSRNLTKIDISFETLCLEKPHFRKIPNKNISIFMTSDAYPTKYNIDIVTLFRFLKELLWIKKEISIRKPDVVLAVDLHSILLFYINQLFTADKTPWISSIHNNSRDTISSKLVKIYRPILRMLLKCALNQSDVVTCVSRHLAKDVTKYFSLTKTPKTIYNGIEIKNNVEPRNFPNKRFEILSVGRLDKQKDFGLLLESFEQLVRKNPNLRLNIVGDGPLKSTIVKSIKRLQLTKFVNMLGWLQKPDKVYKNSDLFILSSKREGFGYVLIEAMSFGLPIISTNTPFGPKEILGNGKYGILVPVSNKELMSKAIFKIIRNKKLYTSLSKLSLIRSKDFDVIAMLKEYHNLFLTL